MIKNGNFNIILRVYTFCCNVKRNVLKRLAIT